MSTAKKAIKAVVEGKDPKLVMEAESGEKKNDGSLESKIDEYAADAVQELVDAVENLLDDIVQGIQDDLIEEFPEFDVDDAELARKALISKLTTVLSIE